MTTAPSDIATIDADVICISCGYNLRSLNHDANCPECGHGVADSLHRHHLADPLRGQWQAMPPRPWLVRMRVATIILLLKPVIMAVPLAGLVHWARGNPPFIAGQGENLWSLLYVWPSVIVNIAALWLLATPAYDNRSRRLHRALRAVAVAILVGHIVLVWRLLEPTSFHSETAALAAEFVLKPCWLAMSLGILWLLRDVARRANNRRVVKMALYAMLTVLAATLLNWAVQLIHWVLSLEFNFGWHLLTSWVMLAATLWTAMLAGHVLFDLLRIRVGAQSAMPSARQAAEQPPPMVARAARGLTLLFLTVLAGAASVPNLTVLPWLGPEAPISALTAALITACITVGMFAWAVIDLTAPPVRAYIYSGSRAVAPLLAKFGGIGAVALLAPAFALHFEPAFEGPVTAVVMFAPLMMLATAACLGIYLVRMTRLMLGKRQALIMGLCIATGIAFLPYQLLRPSVPADGGLLIFMTLLGPPLTAGFIGLLLMLDLLARRWENLSTPAVDASK